MTNHLTTSVPNSPLVPIGLTPSDALRIATAVEAELAASARATYASAWRHWETWCGERNNPALPAVPEMLAAYLTERAETGVCTGTLDGACAAITHRHHQEGQPDPTADVLVRRVRRGLRRIMGTAPRRQAHPLTVTELAQLVTSIDQATAIGVRDRAVVLLSYASALRPGELSALTWPTSFASRLVSW